MIMKILNKIMSTVLSRCLYRLRILRREKNFFFSVVRRFGEGCREASRRCGSNIEAGAGRVWWTPSLFLPSPSLNGGFVPSAAGLNKSLAVKPGGGC